MTSTDGTYHQMRTRAHWRPYGPKNTKKEKGKSESLPKNVIRNNITCNRSKLSGPVHTYPEIFCIRKFFYADTKISASTRSVYESYTTVHTYPIRIRTSQRISQQSMRITKKAELVTSAYTKIYGYERPHVSGHTAYTEISTLESVYRNLRIHRAYTADTCGR